MTNEHRVFLFHEPELVSGDENVVVLKSNGETVFFACYLQIALNTSCVNLRRNRQLTNEYEIIILPTTVQVGDINVMTGKITAKFPNDAGTILAKCRNNENVIGRRSNLLWWLVVSDNDLIAVAKFGSRVDFLRQFVGLFRTGKVNDHDEGKVAVQDGLAT